MFEAELEQNRAFFKNPVMTWGTYRALAEKEYPAAYVAELDRIATELPDDPIEEKAVVTSAAVIQDEHFIYYDLDLIGTDGTPRKEYGRILYKSIEKGDCETVKQMAAALNLQIAIDTQPHTWNLEREKGKYYNFVVFSHKPGTTAPDERSTHHAEIYVSPTGIYYLFCGGRKANFPHSQINATAFAGDAIARIDQLLTTSHKNRYRNARRRQLYEMGRFDYDSIPF